MTLPANWTPGSSFTAAAENAVETAVNINTIGVAANTAAIAAQPTAVVTETNKTFTTPIINGFLEGLLALGVVGSTVTLNIGTATVITATLTASALTTFAMPAHIVGKSQSFMMLLKQAVTIGGGTALFTGVHWNAAGAPTITPTPGGMDELIFVSDSTEWFGSCNQGFTP
jgi:hypothetical protein